MSGHLIRVEEGETIVQSAVERAIEMIWCRYNEPLTVAELAAAANLSRFHFSRVFRSSTGTSPCRFLAAVRLAKAKELLSRSSMNVTYIALEVGYNSLGSFTSTFTKSVGVSPARYRQLSKVGMPPLLPTAVPGARGVVRGLVAFPDTGLPIRVYVGAFDGPITQGVPVAWEVLDAPGPFRLADVPDGRWHIRAAAVAPRGGDPRPRVRGPLFVGAVGPVSVHRDRTVDIDLELHPFGPLDLPVLVALPELDGARLPQPERTVPPAKAVRSSGAGPAEPLAPALRSRRPSARPAAWDRRPVAVTKQRNSG
jgi:AraC-like DNA-binding protein